MLPRRASASVPAIAVAAGLVALLISFAQAAQQYNPQTWIKRDGRFYVNINTTLVESGSVIQDEFAASWYEQNLGWNRNLDQGWSNVALGRDGHRMPKHPVLMPLLSTPLFWALGLPGTLLFNLLLFGVIGGAGFALARRYGSVSAAAFAGLSFALAASMRDYVYDYHVDVLILALFTLGMALASEKRGFWAGVMVGLAVAARPTVLLWLPSLVLIMLDRRAGRQLAWAMLGGAIPLLLYAASNTWLYGMPWWAGYNRVIVMVNGEAQMADHANAFGVPFDEGIMTLWEGRYGVKTKLPLLFAAAPGLVLLLRRRPLYVLAAILGVGASVLIFARYQWYGDRFLWPSAALLVPALAATVDVVGRRWTRLRTVRAPTVAALGCAIVMAAFASVGASYEARFPDGWTQVAEVLAGAAALGFGVATLGARVSRGPMGTLAPFLLLLFPGVRTRLLDPGADLQFAVLLSLAVGIRDWRMAGLFALGLAAPVLNAATSDTTALGLFERLGQDAGRPLLVLVALLPAAVFVMGRRAWVLLPLGLLAVERLASLGEGKLPLFALALLSVAAVAVCLEAGERLQRAAREMSARRRVGVLVYGLLVLLAFGVGRRLDPPAFRIASERGVRAAIVLNGDRPCDFLAWEHLNWECATVDHGVHQEVGLATSSPPLVAGEDRGLLLITTHRGRARIVRWEDVDADRRLRLRYAVPDGFHGGGTLTVRLDGEAIYTVELPPEPDRVVHEVLLETARVDWSGQLELELSQGTVALDGSFEPDDGTPAITQAPDDVTRGDEDAPPTSQDGGVNVLDAGRETGREPPDAHM
ncbi:MAG: hypothetical protein AB8I08_29825 [Sandaracinaceae bacterium]